MRATTEQLRSGMPVLMADGRWTINDEWIARSGAWEVDDEGYWVPKAAASTPVPIEKRDE